MTVVNEDWTFDELTFEFKLDHEKTREEWFSYSAKGELLNEMLRECYEKKDFESEIVKFLDNKREIIRYHRDKFYDIQKYLGNLKEGFPCFTFSRQIHEQIWTNCRTKQNVFGYS